MERGNPNMDTLHSYPSYPITPCLALTPLSDYPGIPLPRLSRYPMRCPRTPLSLYPFPLPRALPYPHAPITPI